jgi:GTP-binding protein Era
MDMGVNTGSADGYRCGMAALVGRANVGKSSLLNAILGDKVSIVSPVAQTTRNMVRAIHSEARGQLVFMDTPGVHKATYELGKIMNRTARASIAGADAAVLVLDPSTRLRDEDEGWMRKLAGEEMPLILVLNKRDLDWPYEQAYREAWARCLGERTRAALWMSVSAVSGAGIADLLAVLFDAMPEGPPLFPEEMLTDFPRKLAIGDVIREKYFRVLHDEVPHDLAVRVGDIEETDAGWTIYADILINRPSQKGIIIGEKGRLLRKVKREATQDLESMYERKITLVLWIKVEKNWTQNHWILKQLGYV